MFHAIYFIKNVVNDKMYIGSAKDLYERWYEHRRRLKRGDHYNSYLQSSWSKYGEENFEFGVLEYLDDADELITREQVYLDLYESYDSANGYNILRFAGSALGHRHTELTRQKMSISQRKRKPASAETRWKISLGLMGLVKSEETCLKLSKISSSRSAEWRRKISEKNSGEGSGNAKRTWLQVKTLRNEFLEGIPVSLLIEKYDIFRSNIFLIIRNKSWVDPEYTPPSESVLKSFSSRDMKARFKNNPPNSKLNHSKATEIRAKFKGGIPCVLLAKQYGVGRGQIYKVIKNQIWVSDTEETA